ncbi:MAG: DUF4395 domain-containing protein [Dietzia sp.]|uniref:DUF4395 domain-containing protein n=1 Tax=Dietzia cercidiphylli TaxID=498199 RepID=A0ABN2J5X1_9ACTN|nr:MULTISPECIES: DUF4395 domain-containing protein [Dietzia]MBB1038165.1 DUF4395 domain-containing protein [Dietzia natronolimnaea]MBB1042017.1 DUF4395 domain-containing protein [Dietzia sp. Cai40]MBB1043591.1 DUF4395 domain-containing protein [Dietzia sp. DQ11-44]MBB1047265.1 DUF4395 domain-containing protein [Dietzia cercidiphylli]MBB1051674.1 DUF4395 domain-containing protein [Dietzia sp. CW19]
MSLREVFAFPEVVNDYAARCTAGLVVTLAVVTMLAPPPAQTWLAAALVVGFALRVAGGPRYSPFGRLSVHVLAPRVSSEPKLVAGAPKRFAQTIGLVMSSVALGLFLGGLTGAGVVVLGVLVAAALAEAALGFCLGCWMYGQLQRVGVVSEDACVDCADIWARPGMTARN